MKFLNKKNKIRFLKHSWILGLGVIPIVASACGVSSTFIKNSYFTSGSNGQLSSNLSLSQISEDTLKTNTGMQAYLKSAVNKILYNWLVELGKKNSDYQSKLDSEITSVNDSYNDLVDTYKDKYGSSWELKFQQEVLDPAGGTKDSYINNQLYTFARNTLTTDLFSSLFISVYDKTKNSVVLNPTSDQILNALKNSTNNTSSQASDDTDQYIFKFDRGIDLLSEENPDDDFAKFQDFIFQKYVEYENPYIVDYTTWKYGTPSGTDGINSVYNTSNTGTDDSSSNNSSSSDSNSSTPSTTTNSSISKVSSSLHDDTSSSDSSSDSSGDSSDSSTTSTAGSYAFPYFGYNGSTNETANTIEKFKNFITNASNNYETNGSSTTTSSSSSSDSLGLKSIDLKYTDDTATMKLVKNNSIFTDQSVEFAAAASYMYGILGSNATSLASTSDSDGASVAANSSATQITNINTSITHNIDISDTTTASTNTNSSNPFDIITKNFVSSSDLYSNSTSGNSKTTTSSINKLKLSANYLKSIINPSGPLSSLLTNTSDYYVIDNFIPGTITTSATSQTSDSNSSTNKLNNFMFFRDSTGVQAVSVDGDTLIGKATTVNQKKMNAAMVVLYRYFLGSDTGASFTVDLSSELSSFFSSNIDWLIYQYANQSGNSITGIDGTAYTQSMFSNPLDGNDKTLADAIANFLPAYTYYNSSYSAAQKMYDAKKTYNQNYGYSVYKNGLASNFNYSYADSDQSQIAGVNSTYLFTNALLASTATNPYTTNSSGINVNSSSSSKDSNSLYQTVLNAISAVTTPLTVQTAYFDKYTQYVYSNNEYVNAALLGTLSNTSFLSAEIQNPILESYISDFYSFTSSTDTSSFNTFKLSNNPFTTANSTDNTDNSKIQTYLQNAMYNFFFLNNFTSETDSLFSYGTTENTKSSTSSQATDSSSSISLDSIRKYSWDLWNSPNNIDYATKVVNYNTLYKTIATVKYLLGTNLSDFLSYMKDLVGDNQAFVVWENSQNTNISSLANKTTSSGSTPSAQDTTTSSSILTSKSLISYTTPITNINNQSYGPYVGNNSSATANSLSYNVFSGNLYQTTLNTSYYAATSAPTTTTTSGSKSADSSTYMMGFKGLQTSANKSLSDDVSTALFTSPGETSIGTKGVLYQYKSLENLKNIVSNISSISDLQTLTTNIDTLTNFKFNFTADIDAQLTLASKKSTLISLLDENLGKSTSSNSNDYFTAFSGYVGAKSTSTTSSGSTSSSDDVQAYGTGTSKYGIYAYQLNADSFSSLSSLQTALGATSGSYETADEIICNLIVQYAAQTTNQSYIIPNLVNESRVTIYDIRVYNAFTSDGATWIRNWKTITTSSSSDSSSSGSSE